MAITMLAGYLVIINAAALLMMAEDKRRAKRHQWRVPEAALFGAALLGGSAGAWAGMYLFHHKTKHWYFVVGMPLILAAQLAAGLEHPVNFCQSLFRPGHNVQGVGDQHRIKGFVRIGQAGGILHRKVQPRPAGFQLCLGDHFGRKIRSLPVPHQAGKPEAELAGPAGQFQHVHFRRQVRLHLLRNGSIQRLAALHQRAIAAGPPRPEVFVFGLF